MTRTGRAASDHMRDHEAAAWLLRLRDADVADDVIAGWIAWCDADPKNRAAYDAMAGMWAVSGGLADAASGRTGPSSTTLPSSSIRRWRWAGGALAASLLAAVVATQLPSLQPSDGASADVVRYETERGRLRTMALADGSRIQLGGKSALSVRFSSDARLVIAESGEAFYQVAKDRARPFVVQAGPLSVTAVGTAFSVERDANSVSVSVAEGVIEVRAFPNAMSGGRTATPPIVLRATAGQRVRFDRGELTQTVDRNGTDIATDWRAGRLEFKDEPLRLVVARINRYSPQQIEITDPAIEDLRVTTTLYQDRFDAWLDGIEMVLPVRVARTTDRRITIAPAFVAPVEREN